MSFVLRFFIFLRPAGVLGAVSREGLNKIILCFSGVSFNMLIHPNVGKEGSRLLPG